MHVFTYLHNETIANSYAWKTHRDQRNLRLRGEGAMTGREVVAVWLGDKQMVILSQFVLLVKLQVILSSDLCSHQPSGASGHTLTHISKYTFISNLCRNLRVVADSQLRTGRDMVAR